MTLTFYKASGFKKLSDPIAQQKEVYFLYGVCVYRLTSVDAFFIQGIRLHKFDFPMGIVGKEFSEDEWNKFQAHSHEKATLGMLIKDFREFYFTDAIPGLDDLLDKLLKTRNVTIHTYMKVHASQLDDLDSRIEIYNYLLEVFELLEDFERFIKTVDFFTSRKYPTCKFIFKRPANS